MSRRHSHYRATGGYPFRLCLLGLLMLLWAQPATAQDNATLPYETAHRYLALFDSLAHLDLIEPALMIASTNPDVKPTDIEFRIVGVDGWESIRPAENGVIEIPVKEEWLQGGKSFISNQPKGTLRLEVAFHARPLAAERMPYRDFMALADQFGEALSALAELQGTAPPDIKGLTLQMPAGGSVEILSSKRQRTLKANAAGILIMKTDAALLTENPEIVFSEIPPGVIPLQ